MTRTNTCPLTTQDSLVVSDFEAEGRVVEFRQGQVCI